MQSYNMKRVVPLNSTESLSEEDLTEEVTDYIKRVDNIFLMDESFLNDFLLGISLWSLTAGYTGAW